MGGRVAAALMVVAIGACGPAPSVSPPDAAAPSSIPSVTAAPTGSDGLVLLVTDEDGTHHLEVLGSASGGARLDLPVAVDWASMDRSGRILVTTRDHRLILSSPIRQTPGAAASWRPLGLTDPPGLATPADLSVGSLSPDGTRALVLASPPYEGDSYVLLAVEIPADSSSPADSRSPPGHAVLSRIIRVAGQAEGVAPVWLDDRHAVVRGRNAADEPVQSVVDVAAGSVVAGPSEPLLAAASTDPGNCTGTGVDRTTLWVEPCSAWLADARSGVVVATSADGLGYAVLASNGRRLAVTRPGADGVVVEVLDEVDGAWQSVDRRLVDNDRWRLVAPLGWLAAAP